MNLKSAIFIAVALLPPLSLHGTFVVPNPRRATAVLRSGVCFYSPFRGADGDKMLANHLERLPQDAEEEIRRMIAFTEKMKRGDDYEEKARMKMHDRRDWKEKFTKDELDLIDRYFGNKNAFETLTSRLSQGDPEMTLICGYSFLDFLEKTASTLSSVVDAEIFKKRVAVAAETVCSNLPPISPLDGFPKNDDVIKRHEKWVDSLKAAESGGFTVPFKFASMESPFGPVSSSSCYEELEIVESVTLHQLRVASRGGAMPHSKILLTVVHVAVVSPNHILTTVVQDTDGQFVQLQIHNLNDVQPTSEGVSWMPIGSLFFLKKPFLKIAADGWLVLRSDQPFDLERLDLPPLHGSILVVGDGDFSFSAALAKQNNDRGDAFIVASSLDSERTVIERYAKGESNLDVLKANTRVAVYHGIDASDLSPLGDFLFDSIVWNFPYPTDEKGTVHPPRCRVLLAGFLGNVKTSLKSGGRVYIVLAKSQGGTNREVRAPTLAWDVETLALNAGLEVVEVLPFSASDYEGYEPRRAYNDTSFPYEDAKMHILQLRREYGPGEGPTQRTEFSRMMSLFIDQVWGPTTHTHSPWAESIEKLLPDTERSQTARSLVSAASSFGKAMQIIEMHRDVEFRNVEWCSDVVQQLARVYSTRHGELVCSYCSKENVVLALFCSQAALCRYFDVDIVSSELSDFIDFMKSMGKKYRHADSVEKPCEDATLADFLLVAVALWALVDLSVAIEGNMIALQMEPKSPHLLSLLTLLKANHLSDAYSPSGPPPEAIQEVISDCWNVLDVIPDESDPLHVNTLYTLARMGSDLSITLGSATEAYRAIALFEKYISLVDPCDQMLSKAHYRAGYLRLQVRILEGVAPNAQDYRRARMHYTQGVDAEKQALAFFGSSSCPFKRLLYCLLMVKPDAPNEKQPKSPRAVTPQVADRGTFHKQIKELLRMDAFKSGIYLDDFEASYKKAFGKPVPQYSGEGLQKTLQRAADASVCLFEMRKGGRWLTSWNQPTPAKKGHAAESTDENAFYQEIQELLEAQPEKRLYLGNFKLAYQRRFGKPAPLRPEERVRQALQRAADAGACSLENRSSTEIWVAARTLQSSERSSTTWSEKAFLREMLQLLGQADSENGLYLGSFRSEYKRVFRKEFPLNCKGLRSALQRAADAGVCKLEKRGSPELWITSTKSTPNNATGVDKQPVRNGTNSFHGELTELLERHAPITGIYLASFPQLYEKVFGKPVPRRDDERLLAILQRAADAGACTLKKAASGGIRITRRED